MAEPLDREITAAREGVAEHNRLRAALQRAEAALKAERARESELRARAAAERADVERLEGLTLTRLFQTVLGTREERLDQERREHLAARLQLDSARAAITELTREASALAGRVAALGDVGARLNDALRLKEEALAAAGGQRGRALLETADALGTARSLAREASEAYAAGMEALNGLKAIEGELGKARDWGTLDMVGGGMLATMSKHEHMDRAAEIARRVQSQLRRFEGELAEVGRVGAEGLSVKLDDFTRFADYFFDGVITDWSVQSRISDSLQRVQRTRNRVRDLLTRLELEISRTRAEEVRLESERLRLIESA